eukprot:3374505-Amphidinium_carterae.1
MFPFILALSSVAASKLHQNVLVHLAQRKNGLFDGETASPKQALRQRVSHRKVVSKALRDRVYRHSLEQMPFPTLPNCNLFSKCLSAMAALMSLFIGGEERVVRYRVIGLVTLVIM